MLFRSPLLPAATDVGKRFFDGHRPPPLGVDLHDRFPHEKDQVPDIINQEYRVIGRDGQRSEPGFKTPGESNGFALIGEFESLDEAREFYRDYDRVEEGLQFEVDSDTVKLYQVWIQKSSLGNYAKLLVTGIEYRQTEQGAPINEVQVEYIYQSNGSRDFPN